MRLPLHQLPPPRPSLAGPTGQSVLEDETDPAARLLWATVRAADLRSRTASDRDSLFGAGSFGRQVDEILTARLDRELEEALLSAAHLLRRDAPDVGVSAAGLVRLALWADGVGRQRTALVLYEAAGRLAAGDPERSLLAGRAARDRGEWARAERWLERSILLARRTEQWDCYVRALGAHGKMEFVRGRLGRARSHLGRALRRARREGLGESRGLVAHDLISVELQGAMVGRSRLPEDARDRAEALAEEAFRAYGPLHSLVYALAHDAAVILALRGEWTEALPVFRATVERAPDEVVRTIAWSGVAWAASHVGNEELAVEALERVEARMGAYEVPARALVEATEASLTLGMWNRAAVLAEQGLAIARSRGEAAARFELEDQVEAIRERRRPETAPVPQQNAPTAGVGGGPRPWVRELVVALGQDSGDDLW